MRRQGFWTQVLKVTAFAAALSMLPGCSKQTSEDHIQAAQQYLAENNTEAAVVELKNAVQLSPQSAEARFELGKLYLQSNDFESAEKELNRAMEYGYPASQVIPLLSEAYQRTGAHVALSKLDHQQGLTPVEEVKVGFYKVQSLVQLDKTDDARVLIYELGEIDTRSVYKGLSQAYLPVLDQDYAVALEQVKTLREQSPLNKDVLNMQAQLHLMLNQMAEASDVYQVYLEQAPDDPQTKFVLAKLLVDQGKTSEAEPYVDDLLALNPDNGMLNQLKGIIRAAANDFAGGQQFTEKAIQTGRGDPVLRLVAGFSAYQQEDYEAANRHLSYIASSLPDNHPGLKLLAASQLQLGLGSEASDVLARVDQVSSQDAPLFSRAGYELLREGNVKQAEQIVERTSSISATADDLTRLGVLQLSMNNIEGIVNLEAAVAKAPESATAQTTLATAYLATNQFTQAMQLAESWKQSAPDDVRAYLLAGQVHLRQQQFDQARQEYQAAATLAPQDNNVKMALVNLDLTQGNQQQALQGIEQLLQSQPDYVPALASYYVVQRGLSNSQLGMQPTQQAFAAAPDNVALRLLLARMYNFESQFADSLQLLESFTADKQAPAEYWQIKSQALLQTNQISDAELHLDKWLSFYPNDKTANLSKLLLLDSQAEYAEGLALTQTFLSRRDDAQMDILNTYFLVMNRQVAEARSRFDALPQSTRELPFVKGILARLQLQENNPQQALPNALAAYQQSPVSRNMMLVVLCHETLGQTEDSYQFLSQHNQQYPTDLRAKMLLAERQISRDTQGAISTYEQALSLNENNFVVLNNLAYLYLQQGQVEKARQHASKAVAIQPENPATLDTLAQVLVADEEYAEALQYYERIIQDQMRNEEIYLNYVETLLLAGQNDLARRKLDQRQFELPASLQRAQALQSKYGI